MSSILTQIIVAVGTILTIIGGFLIISNAQKKRLEEAVETIEGNFDKKLSNRSLVAKGEKAEEALIQKELCTSQRQLILTIDKNYRDFQVKYLRQAKMNFQCHFTTLVALDNIAHDRPVNGDIRDQYEKLRDFTIDESI